MQEILSEIRSLISAAVAGCRTESISLSGGLDSSILASFLGGKTKAYTVVARDFPSPDLVSAKLISNIFDLDLKVISVTVEGLLEAVEDTIRILRVFNPIEVRNTVVDYIAMKQAKMEGFKSIMTGDGADELFAGYNFFQRMGTTELQRDLERIWQVMHFPSRLISEAIGIDLYTPFLETKVAEFAKSLSADLKVREVDGKKYGKWILRKSFEKSLPQSIVWGKKSAMQDGSGTAGLSGFLDGIVSDSDLAEKSKKYLKEEHVALQSGEALHYYEIYRKYYDYPEKLDSSEPRCPNCKNSIKEGARFCRMCGTFPI